MHSCPIQCCLINLMIALFDVMLNSRTFKDFQGCVWTLLKVTDRSFQYASPHLWNKLPFSLHEPVSPLYAYLNPSFSSPLYPSITPSLFHSEVKTYLFGKSFPHRSLTIDTTDWLPRLMGPFSVFARCKWPRDETNTLRNFSREHPETETSRPRAQAH